MAIDLDPVLPVARQAGEAILRVYSRPFGVSRKADRSPVTEADTAAHRIIARLLRETYPGIPVLSEESVEVRPYEERRQWGRYWLVDPLDGTKEFIKRNGQFTVNIALVEDGRPVAGVVYAPVSDRLYFGSLREGAFKAVNGKRAVQIHCRPPPTSGRVNVVGSSSHLSLETRAVVRELRKSFAEVHFVAMGSSLKICLVADGTADLYPRLAPTMEWDTAAAHAVLSAAGGRLLAYPTEAELRYNKRDLRNGWFVAVAAGPASAALSQRLCRAIPS